MDGFSPSPVLGTRFADAVRYAARLHSRQTRKASDIPYVSHLLGAAALVVEQPGTTEDQAIAALLHDAIEDQGEQTSVEEIGERFGSDVARMVADCTDAWARPKPPWRHRKDTYLAHVREMPTDSLQVSLADKLHNATAILHDLADLGPAMWTRFNAPPVAQRWYFISLADAFGRRLDTAVSRRFQRIVTSFTADLPEEVAFSDSVDRPGWVDADTVTACLASIEQWPRVNAGEPVARVAANAWATDDGQWWIEQAANGNPSTPLTVFVRPPR